MSIVSFVIKMKLLLIDLSKISNTKIYILLGLLILIIYGNAINNEYSLDDDLVVYKHQVVDKGVKSTKDIFQLIQLEVSQILFIGLFLY
tara:strand:+ start:1147 stop:1413 length:267 start_codon:yes stop_codon:yes gene_type:complete